MTFSARKSLADAKLPPFDFTDLDDVPRQLPHLKSLSVDLVTKFEDAGLIEVIAELADADVAAALSAMPVAVIEELAQAWQAHAVADPGESPASSPSTGSTARRSRPTLPATTGSRTRKR